MLDADANRSIRNLSARYERPPHDRATARSASCPPSRSKAASNMNRPVRAASMKAENVSHIRESSASFSSGAICAGLS